MAIIKAKREKTPLRVALTGPTNAGKTYTAILIAIGKLQANFPNESLDKIFDRIVIIDTERGRAKFYADRSDLPTETKSFNYMEIEAPYSPNKYIDAVLEADEFLNGEGVIIIDSLSHAWNYSGGVLDIKSALDKKGGNSYTNWADPTKMHNDMINRILSTKSSVIATMRSKMDYVLEVNDKGRQAPKKVGLKPVQRDDTEFEFDVTLMLDDNHTATIIKDTTFLLSIADENKNLGVVTPELGLRLARWLDEGVDPKDIIAEEHKLILAQVQAMAKQHPTLKSYFKTKFPDKKTAELSYLELKTLLQDFKEIVRT